MLTLKDIAKEMTTQDNRGTASPMMILLQTKKEYVGHPDYSINCEERYVEQTSGDYRQFKSYKELLDWWNEDMMPGDQLRELEKGKHYVHVHMDHYWETENVFFTDAAYEKHMQVNGHNYRKGEVRSYGIHCFRNEEMKLIHETILKERY